MRDVNDRVRRERQRQHRKRLMRIADERRGGDNQEPEGQRDVESDPELPFVIDGGSHVRAGDQRKQQRCELCEPKFGDQAIR